MKNLFKTASLGSISHGTLRTQDLLESFANELEWQIARNGDFFAMPENHEQRNRLAKVLGEAQDAWNEDGETLTNEDNARELVDELQDALNEFCGSFVSFGTHPGDGADFGYWVDVDEARESVDFVSSKEQGEPDADFEGEWLSVNERGNCTLYVRGEDGKDVEIWGVC